MRIAVTGASGLAGYPVARHLEAGGHEVVSFGRAPVAGLGHVDYALGDAPPLAGFGAVVHCALAHLPGRYRGGEGSDPEGFRRANLDGTLRLFEAAEAAGALVVFLSSRAVYGERPPGTELSEETEARPDTLYGRVKLAAERALPTGGVALRATGVYGPPVPGRGTKWDDLFRRFAAGEVLAPRVSTEVHGDDLGQAVALALEGGAPRVLNVSDVVLDRRDLLEGYAEAAGVAGVLPETADASAICAMSAARLRALGWRPRGRAGVAEVLRALTRSTPPRRSR